MRESQREFGCEMGPLCSGPSFLCEHPSPTTARLEVRNALCCVCDLHPQGCNPFVMFVRYARTVRIFHGFNGTAPVSKIVEDLVQPGEVGSLKAHEHKQ